MTISPVELASAIAACVAGALIQGSIGFGFSLVVAPVLGLIQPEALPATILFLALPMTTWMSLRERRDIDARGFFQMTAGRVPGTVVAAWIIAVVSVAQLSVIIGSAVVVAAGISALAPEFEVTTGRRFVAGIFSGFMGTVAAVGGPALALAYQSRPGAELRSTLALSFVVGSVISLAALAIAGEVEGSDVALAVKLLPGLIGGLALAALVSRFLDERWLRPAVLIFAVLSGAAAIVKGLA